MKNFYPLYTRELQRYFLSPAAYMVIGAFLLVSAYFFNHLFNGASLQVSADQSPLPSLSAINVPEGLVRNYFGMLATLLVFLTPLLTMSTYSDEYKQGTIELLMTSPITDLQIVLGKYCACMTLFVAMLLPTVLPFGYAFAHSKGPAPWPLLLCGYLGAILLGSSLVVLGGLFSSLTSTPILAAFLTFGVIQILWICGFWLKGDLRGVAAVLQYCSTFQHFDRFTRGVFDTSDCVFYITFLFLGLFVTVRSLESMRWLRA